MSNAEQPHRCGQDAASSPQDSRRDVSPAGDSAFMRALGEDDDGYDPYSDRPAEREPMFMADPWR